MTVGRDGLPGKGARTTISASWSAASTWRMMSWLSGTPRHTHVIALVT